MSDQLSNAQRIDLERRIVRGLIRHMRARGFITNRVNDGGAMVPCLDNEVKAMEAVFSVDESSLRFVPVSCAALRGNVRWNFEHGVLLVCGNGEDIISDWNYSEGDADGFNSAMQAYEGMTELPKRNRIVICISGGAFQGASAEHPEGIEIVLNDRDNVEAGDPDPEDDPEIAALLEDKSKGVA